MKILILAEHENNRLNPALYQAVTAAQHWKAPIDVLVLGHEANSIVQEVAAISAVSKVLHAEAAQFAHILAEDAAQLIHGIAGEYQVILAAHSSFTRNILPRVAALLDVAMISDVLRIEADNTYVRSIYAGNIHATIQSEDTVQVLTIHASQFSAAAKNGSAEVVSIATPAATDKTRFVTEYRNLSDRPPLSTAKIVVSGGRSLGSAEKFNEILSPLATKLGAALGATRAAVDAGYAPNDIQVGQTGVVVAPELYIAVGVSGAIQHTYGMKDSKIVVAINQDPDAPIFQIADYGLVSDLFEAVPALTAAIR
jgi:electron transfer flavoprotein alpha subunit